MIERVTLVGFGLGPAAFGRVLASLPYLQEVHDMMIRESDPAPIGTLEELMHELETAPVENAARRLQRLIEEERELSRLNVLKPYEDKVPLALQGLGLDRIVEIFEFLADDLVMRALFGNFRTVDDEVIANIAQRMDPARCAQLVWRMSIGVDNPGRITRILRRLPGVTTGEVLRLVPVPCVLALLDQLSADDRWRMLESLDPQTLAALLAGMLGSSGNRVRIHRVGEVLTRCAGPARELLLERLPDPGRQGAAEYLGMRFEGSLAEGPLSDCVHRLMGLELDRAVSELLAVPHHRAAEILKLCPPDTTTAFLAALAGRDCGLAADLLEELNSFVILRLSKGTPITEVYTCRSSLVLERIPLEAPGVVTMLEELSDEDLEIYCRYVPDEKREGIRRALPGRRIHPQLPFSFHSFTAGRGRRRSTRLANGLRWTHIEETLDTGEKIKPVVIDLVEIPRRDVDVRCCRGITEEGGLPVSDVARIFGDASRDGRRPDQQLFTSLGLIQLSKIVAGSGAIAAINGNHYYDYGHYMDALKLGIDPSAVPGLFFGDPVGWFVENGVEISPPSFNRAALVVTDEGDVGLRRVFMTSVTLSNGATIGWDDLNCNKAPGRIILYNSLYGFRTQSSETHVDLACAKNRIFEMRPGGGGFIPLTGFTLSIPVERREDLLHGIEVGATVRVGNNLPPMAGRVTQAMACGPSLVCDRQLDISFRAEDFGEKDSTVMSFSLTRAVETFEAARSFIALRGDDILIGTVSGTALGTGAPKVSGGMTFGELAQLALDLQVDQAMALDGGGSSSIVVRDESGTRCLNVPTGGSDVKAGEERFINTYLQFFRKES